MLVGIKAYKNSNYQVEKSCNSIMKANIIKKTKC